MAGIDNLWLFIAAGWLLNLTPGPDVLFIVSNGLRRGARAGAVAALGITAGCFVHIFAAAIGVSALIAASSTAFTVLKWLGAAYLVYVGLNMVLAKTSGLKLNAPDLIAERSMDTRVDGLNASQDLKKIFIQGFWTNALNPKVALFFLAFLPQFMAHDAVNKTLTFVLLGLIFNINAIPVNMGYALGAAWLSRRFASVQQGMGWLERGAGALFVAFGIKLALSEHAAP